MDTSQEARELSGIEGGEAQLHDYIKELQEELATETAARKTAEAKYSGALEACKEIGGNLTAARTRGNNLRAALEEIALETGTPYARVAQKALDDNA